MSQSQTNHPNNIITLTEYANGYDKTYPEEWEHVKDDAIRFLEQLNAFLLEAFPTFSHKINSGWRPRRINQLTRGASQHSYHMIGRAIDLSDADKAYRLSFRPLDVQEHADLLRKHGLFMEHPLYTTTWVHFDNGYRLDRATRVFVP